MLNFKGWLEVVEAYLKIFSRNVLGGKEELRKSSIRMAVHVEI
jgi:hypothetical protein